jgi:hypothetical protein
MELEQWMLALGIELEDNPGSSWLKLQGCRAQQLYWVALPLPSEDSASYVQGSCTGHAARPHLNRLYGCTPVTALTA